VPIIEILQSPKQLNEDLEAACIAEARFLYEFGTDFDSGYYYDRRSVNGIFVELESYRTKNEQFIAFKVSDAESATIVYAYPGHALFKVKTGKEDWQVADEMLPLHRQAVDKTKTAIEEGKRIQAEQITQASSPRKVGGILVQLVRLKKAIITR